ncbi:PH domain-containing protein [Glaesserella parasuis]|uniref:PH domain-containing protein n=1 Tax=Glaesserella parasuis TaxID=738 RepID=UPI0003AC3CDB|nr:PH domain-containing protein [Glaesserella parasuis]ATW43455.1 hypothetical protein A2U20_06445 [Glaesserella parasuis D74]EQA10939.1 hypothetical protein HPSD74_0641 [Glaesserella parasuis D74]MDP0316818.1 PH domain-containing protein [Glaesserella parasuis]
MSLELKPILVWIFHSECEIPDDVQNLLVSGERAIKAYKAVRDIAIFTDRRLIVRDTQGLRGKKIEIYSLPYENINMWSSENAGGLLDFTSEIELWTRAGHIKLELSKDIDVRQFDKLIAECVLGK